MWKALTLSLSLTLGITTSAMAGDPWRVLADIKIEEFITGEEFLLRKTYPEKLRKMAEGFEIEGFYVVIEPQPQVRYLFLVEDTTICPFCGSGGPGQALPLEVILKRPMDAVEEFTRIRVTGDLEFIESTETMQAVRLVDARVLSIN